MRWLTESTHHTPLALDSTATGLPVPAIGVNVGVAFGVSAFGRTRTSPFVLAR